MKKPSRKLTQREVIIGYVTLVVVLIGFFKFFCLPQYYKTKATATKTAELEAKIQRESKMIGEFQSRSLASTQETLKNSPMGEYIGSSRRLAQVVEHLVGGDKHLVTRMIKFEKVTDKKDHRDVSFTVEIVGSFQSIGSFIERLESSHLLAEVSTVNVARLGADLDKCVAKISLNARLFPEGEDD